MGNKRLKDPIYGYIDIKEEVIKNIIDTAEFQRLRNVIQTSYAPLYSSAVHNRFVHSLGVYHLGKLVAGNLKELNSSEFEMEQKEYEQFLDTFLLACLLHDVGHAPFSHTGEEFYLESGKRDKLHKKLSTLTQDGDLQVEIEKKSYMAAPHELMSAIVGLERFGDLIGSEIQKSFFARCITGYLYDEKDDVNYKVLNCIISLLNSSVIDVDKLDYLIRDAYITGFDTMNIDYERLLSSIYIKKDRITKEYEIVYTRGAISVIENVVYAHDAERKWIQNHPIVQYEGFLLNRIFRSLNKKYGENTLFSEEALSVKGIFLEKENVKVSLLCDGDIIFLMKNLEQNGYVDEYLDRKERRHPLWKSEAEYKAMFGSCFTEKAYNILDDKIEKILKYLNYNNCANTINESALKACEKDIKEEEDRQVKEKEGSKIWREIARQISEKREYKKWLETFKEFAEEQKVKFDFVILEEKVFSSGFSKEKLPELKVEFPGLNSLNRLGSVSTVLSAQKSGREKFFYVFYKRDKKEIRAIELVNKLYNLVKIDIQ